MYPRSPTGRPYPPSGPGTTSGTRVYPPLCGSGYTLCILRYPTGRPYRPSGPRKSGGTRVYPPLCGSGRILCMLVLPRGAPSPQAAEAGPGELGCICRYVGVAFAAGMCVGMCGHIRACVSCVSCPTSGLKM